MTTEQAEVSAATLAERMSEWVALEMPDYEHENLLPWKTLPVHFASEADMQAFAELVGRNLTPKTKSIWYPQEEIGHYSNKRYVGRPARSPRFPVYIPSKGRAHNAKTMHELERLGVPYYVVVEEQEYEAYRGAGYAAESLLVLDPAYQDGYEACDDLGRTKSLGPGPARNFAWDHSIAQGHEWHWVMDDNIEGFYHYQHNLKTPVGDATTLWMMEEFALRYSNVAMAGPNYFMFVQRKAGNIPPFITNTRIYSCNLIRNDAPYRWRGRYNEDTDLSLRMLKDGWCTVQFNAFLAGKTPTQQMRGGNTDAFYAQEGTRAKSDMLVALHPDVARSVTRFKRDHHYVNYKGFKQPLVRREGGNFSSIPRLVLQQLDPGTGCWSDAG